MTKSLIVGLIAFFKICFLLLSNKFGNIFWCRNMQMMLSSLLQHTGYNEQLYRQWVVGVRSELPSRSAMPSLSRLQRHIEWAWHQGFDLQGCDQLGGKLANTRKWIGATEVVTVLSSLRIR